MIGRIEWRGKNKDNARLVVNCGLDGHGRQIRETRTLGKVSITFARKALAAFVTEIENGEVLRTSKLNFRQFVEQWLRDYADNALAPKTRARYMDMLESRITPALGNMKLNQIKPQHILALYAEMRAAGGRKDGGKGGLSELTVLHHHRLLHRIFSHAVYWQIIPGNPVSRVPAPKIPRKELRVYDNEEIDLLYEALAEAPELYRLAVTLALNTGMRAEEMTGLKWSRVSFDTGRILVCEIRQWVDGVGEVVRGTKTDSPRYIPISDELRKELLSFQEIRKANRGMIGTKWFDSDYVLTHPDGKPVHPTTPGRWFADFIAKYDLPKITLHGLRHTFATQLLAAGVPLAVVSAWLGHSQRSTTLNIYTHPSDKGFSMGAETINSVLGPSVAGTEKAKEKIDSGKSNPVIEE